MRFYTLFSTASRVISTASRAIMQPYGDIHPDLQTGFQNYLQKTFGRGQLYMFASNTLTVRVDARCFSPEKQNKELMSVVDGLQENNIISSNRMYKNLDTANGKWFSCAVITIDKVDPQAITQLIAEESCEQTTTTPRNK
jgi:hypothetical protein